MIADKLYVWGDSIARGVYFDKARNQYSVCRDTFDHALRALGVAVRNFAKPGCTSKAALDMTETADIQPGAVAAIEFGGNDSDLKWSEVSEKPDEAHRALVPLNAYADSLKALIARARKLSLRPVIVTPIPVVAERYFKWVSAKLNPDAILKYLGSAAYIYRWQERYAYMAMQAARDADCPVFDLRSQFLDRRDFESLMSEDGIHPTPDGYRLIRDSVLSAWNTGNLNLPLL